MTVKELIEKLSEFPEELEVAGYDGTDADLLISVYLVDYEDCEEIPKRKPQVVIDVDQ